MSISGTEHNRLLDEIESLRSRLAAAVDAIERAGSCLVMSNNGATEALKILREAKHLGAFLSAAPAVTAPRLLSCGCYYTGNEPDFRCPVHDSAAPEGAADQPTVSNK
jgi:hypothetical protein